MSTTRSQLRPSALNGPAWDIALLFPEQGSWTETDYLEATRHTRKLVELNDGVIDVLPMPTFEHQRIVGFLYRMIFAFLLGRSGAEVVIAPAKVRLRSGRFREPDLLVRLSGSEGDTSDYAVHVDIAIEVVSPSWADHDLVVKRREYAEAGIPEYWIVDPSTSVITVLRLAGGVGSGGYETVGEFGVGTRMTSAVLAGLSVDVGEVFAAAKPS